MGAVTQDCEIRINELSLQLAGRPVLGPLNLQADAPRIGIVGRNGSGKSTLARLLAGLIAPSSGSLTIGGVDVHADRRAALRMVGILFQNPEHQIIFPIVSEEITFGLRQMGASRDQALAQADAVLARFDRLHWRDAPVSALSQGQKHLVCIMAVLAMRPRLLILDEPFAGLDIPTRMQLTRHLDASGLRLLHISHDPADLAGYDQLFWLDRGRIVATGDAARVLSDFTAEMTRLGALDDLADLAH